MYVKILKDDMKHNDMQYQEGINTDIYPFDERPYIDGGLFFSDENHINAWFEYGSKIAVVLIPEKEKVVPLDFGLFQKYKAHRIILSEIRDMFTLETVLWMKSVDIDIHAYDEALLLAAVINKKEAFIKFLIEKEHAQCGYAFRRAVENGYSHIIPYLVEAGADIHSNDDLALRSAVRSDNLKIVQYLIENGADVHAQYEDSLQISAERGNLEIMKLLIASGADIHSSNDEALYNTASWGRMECVQFLMEHGADIHAVNERALRTAVEKGYINIAEYLIKYGANIKTAIRNAKRVKEDKTMDAVQEYIKTQKAN